MPLPELSQGELRGRGMTSQRTRDRMIERLLAQGVRNQRVLGGHGQRAPSSVCG